ncbi:MAG: Holliday junction resolvase RuvX [Actinomycetaceae bacterium]|nr:Holliday junction resolvase RuvX [Actinomycetaceae bacterium]
MRRGRRIGVDVGDARVGIAQCDPDGILATPVETLRRDGSDIRRAAQIVGEAEAIEVVVGLPLNMDGSEGRSAAKARSWARKLARKIEPVGVRLVDERLSTVSAHAQLSAAGRDSRTHRTVVDQAAAVIILQTALDWERRTGLAPGHGIDDALETH